MAYIPHDAEWFIADLVLEFTIGDEENHVVHINMVLVQANTAEEAYEKALELGKAHEDNYTNADGDPVEVRFIGLRELNVIHDKLEHGAELTYENPQGLTNDGIRALAKPKQRLAIFREDDER
jgi:hypothetical protein